MFSVKFENKILKVYDVKTASKNTLFLMFTDAGWVWRNANYFEPCE